MHTEMADVVDGGAGLQLEYVEDCESNPLYLPRERIRRDYGCKTS